MNSCETMREGKAHIESWLPFDVVEAAKRRVLWCYESYDCPLVSFSGGKDSLAVLLVAVEVCRPLGIKPHVYFMDEEFVPTRTLDFVRWVLYESEYAGHLIPHWLCWQMESEIYHAGSSRTIVQWGKDREEWLRPPPKDALMDGEHVYDIFTPDEPLAKLFAGRSVVSMLGLRSGESLVRMSTLRRSAGARHHPAFIRHSKCPQVHRAVPIYDWHTNDVLKFLLGRRCINPIYYEMACAGKTLRSDTPLHGRRCNVAAFKKIDPQFFDRLVALFPEVHSAAIYNESVKSLKEMADEAGDKYGRTWMGLLAYAKAEIADATLRDRAEGVIYRAARNHKCQVKKGLEGIPLLRAFKAVVGKNLDHDISLNTWSKADREW